MRVFVPEVADFEVRRKLLHIGATAGVRRLDQAAAALDYAPITTGVMRRAAELWAAPGSLDGDCILAAQALLSVGPGDAVTVATDNVGHLTRFPGLDARPWETVTG